MSPLNFLFTLAFLGLLASPLAHGADEAIRRDVSQFETCDLNVPTTIDTRVWMGNPQKLYDCFQTIPFNATVADETINQLKNLAKAYAFTEIILDTVALGSVYPMKIDLEAELELLRAAIKIGEFKSDYAFHRAVSKLFMRLNEPHTRYDLPKGYGSWLVKPYSVRVKLNTTTNEMMFFLADPGSIMANFTRVADAFQTVLAYNITPHIGKRIVTVDGEGVSAYFQRFAQNFIGTYKDQQIRFNALLRRGGVWQVTKVTRYGLDFPLKHKLSLMTGETIDIPLLAVMEAPGNVTRVDIVSRNFNPALLKRSGESVEEELEKKPAITDGYLSTDHIKEHDDDVRQLEELMGARLKEKPPTLKSHQGDVEIVQTALRDNFIYMVVNKTVPVFKFASFAPIDPGDKYLNGTEFTYFLYVVNLSYTDFRNRGFTSLIVDVSQNSGGLICLAYDILASLVAEWKDYSMAHSTVVFQTFDAKKSPYLNTVLNYSRIKQTYIDRHGDPVTRQRFVDDTWMNPGDTYARNGRTNAYLKRSYFPFSCGKKGYSTGEDDQNVATAVRVPYLSEKLDKLIILTDGTCGSACSVFLTRLQAQKLASVITYGGIYQANKNEPMDSSSFAGGNVVDYAATIRDIQRSGFASQLPDYRPLPTSAYARLTLHETYAYENSTLPREFERYAGQLHLYDWDTLWDIDPVLPGNIANDAHVKLYSAAAAYFPQVPCCRLDKVVAWGGVAPSGYGRAPWIIPTIAAAGVVVLIVIVVIIVLIVRKCRRNRNRAGPPIKYQRLGEKGEQRV